MMVTLAVTVMVPETVDPELGEVMVTTRLPGEGSGSWAKAGSGEVQTRLKTTKRAAVRARPAQAVWVFTFDALAISP